MNKTIHDDVRLAKLSDDVFKRVIGVKRKTYGKMLQILRSALVKLHRYGGKPPKLSVEDKLQIALQYSRDYVTMDRIAFERGISKSTVSDSIRWVEDALVKDGTFSLPGKKTLQNAVDIEVAIVDVTESPVQRPKKNSGNTTREKRSGTR
jgi:hypothetical protein